MHFLLQHPPITSLTILPPSSLVWSFELCGLDGPSFNRKTRSERIGKFTMMLYNNGPSSMIKQQQLLLKAF